MVKVSCKPRHVRTAIERIRELAAENWSCRIFSKVTGEAMYVFKPITTFGPLYLKLVIRNECVVVSFHEEVEV